MKFALIAPFVALCFAVSLYAAPATQPGSPPDRSHRPGMVRDRLQNALGKLDLTADQKAKIEEILKTEGPEIRKLAEEGWQKNREAIQTARKKMLEDIAAVLTDEQKTKFKELTQERRGEDAGRPERPRPGMILDRMQKTLEELNLTANQKTKIEAAIADAKAKLEALHKDAGDKTEGLREKARAIFEELHKTVQAVLTPEQQEKLKQMRPQRGPGNGPGRRPGPPNQNQQEQ